MSGVSPDEFQSLGPVLAIADASKAERFPIHLISRFGLWEADSAKDHIFHQFGIMRDDYTPKPAFDSFQKLMQELGVQ